MEEKIRKMEDDLLPFGFSTSELEEDEDIKELSKENNFTENDQNRWRWGLGNDRQMF
jgi:hypothetical protein